jgi:hypothetical protein
MSGPVSGLAVAISYLLVIVVFSVLFKFVDCLTCDCLNRIKPWRPLFWIADVLIVSGVIAQLATYTYPPQDHQPVSLPEDNDNKLAGFLAGLAVSSTILVVSGNWWSSEWAPRMFWLLTAARVVFACLAVYRLYPGGSDPIFRLTTARIWIQLLLFGGIFLVFIVPLIKG